MDESDGDRPMSSETLTPATAGLDPPSTRPESNSDSGEDALTGSEPPLNRTEILRAIEIVERDSLAISESFASLFASLRLALSEVRFPLYLDSVWLARK